MRRKNGSTARQQSSHSMIAPTMIAHAMIVLLAVAFMAGLSGCATQELVRYEADQERRHRVAGQRSEAAKAELRQYQVDFKKTNQLLVRQVNTLSDLEVLAARAGRDASAARAALAKAKDHYAILEARLKENKNRMLKVQAELRIQELKPSPGAEVVRLKEELAELEGAEQRLKEDLDVLLQS
ncbi:MAG: hypothetical protein GKR94_21410 [Gammaproteobacteria bacterium]|nr:hypothetical protein [Gammaproteobacteria bacterium]